MAYKIEIEDTGERVEAEPGETILDAVLRAGVAFAYSCQAGNCGTCKCEYLSGDIFELEHSEHALRAEERERNVVLACRTQVWGDTAVRRIETEELVLHPSRVMHCRVVGLANLTHDIREVRLSIEAGGPYSFSAGQYAQVEFAPGRSRHYSMANTPDEPELVFQVRHIPDGRTSSFVAEQLRLGAGVKVSGPLGVSYLRDKHAGPTLLIAGGSGLAPIESILRTMLTRSRADKVALYFGVRGKHDVYHEPLLSGLEAQHPNFTYTVVLSEEGGGQHMRAGLVHEAVATDISDVSGYKAYLAGPPPMVEAATQVLLDKGMPQRDIHADAFYNQS
jgi:CDP-4-dehydro-6-deoxyglucose reductase/ferredoxin-NAD(P)+ reductase (naphthalene dioxygenase ferredoxin-specific)